MNFSENFQTHRVQKKNFSKYFFEKLNSVVEFNWF